MIRIVTVSCFLNVLYFAYSVFCSDMINIVRLGSDRSPKLNDRLSLSLEDDLINRDLQMNVVKGTTRGNTVDQHHETMRTTESFLTPQMHTDEEDDKDRPRAKARSATYVGYWSITRQGTRYASFSGIRFAKPLTPENRYHWSEMVEDSSEVFQATKEGPECPQWNIHKFSNAIVGLEDCLFMNIYSPNVSVNKPYPVMVVIPCGHFIFDSGSRYLNGPDYFMDTKEIVVVTFNYRLGPLGFADFRSEKYPANLGLKDQVIALKWVQRNIHGFGGDPDRVTLQGTSSGAVSVHFHYMSPLSKGLFHAGISESGTGLDPWPVAFPIKARRLLRVIASKVGCEWALPPSPLDNADKLAECFRNRTAYQILAATRLIDPELNQIIFLPVIEITKNRPFLPGDPFQVPEVQLPWLCGQNSDETGLIQPLEHPLLIPVRYYTMILIDWLNAIPHWLNFAETAKNPKNVTSAIIRHYTNTYWVDETQVIPLVMKAGADGLFTNPLYMSLLKHEGVKYAYNFAYRQTISNGLFRHPERGVIHSEEQFYLFLKEGIDIQKNNPPADANMSVTLVRLWVNFVKYHNPTPDNSGFNKWEEWSNENNALYNIDQNSLSMMTDPKMDTYKFWRELPYRDKMQPYPFYSNANNTSHKNQRAHGNVYHSDTSLFVLSVAVVICMTLK